MSKIIVRKSQMKFFDLAKKMSFKGDHRCKIGSVIVHKGNVISAGCNQKFIFEDLTQRYNPEKALHAEVASILKLKNKGILKYSQIYVYREDRNGSLAISRPCPGCQRILKSFGLTEIYYTSSEGFHHERL